MTSIGALYRNRDALPLRTRVLCTFGAVAALHAAAVVLLLAGNAGADELHGLTAGFDALTGISLTRPVAGVTGLVLRSLSHSTDELNRLLRSCTDLLRGRWYGQGPLDLRKH